MLASGANARKLMIIVFVNQVYYFVSTLYAHCEGPLTNRCPAKCVRGFAQGYVIADHQVQYSKPKSYTVIFCPGIFEMTGQLENGSSIHMQHNVILLYLYFVLFDYEFGFCILLLLL